MALQFNATTSVDPQEALRRFVDLATPVVEGFGFTMEARGGDRAHWTLGLQNVMVRPMTFTWNSLRNGSRQ